MADPATIFGIVSGAAGLVLQCAKVAKTLGDLAEKHKNAQITILSIIQEVEMIEAAWKKIGEWSHEVDAGTLANSDLLQRLDRSLEVGHIVMSALEEDIAVYRGQRERLSFLQRSKIVWNEGQLQAHQQRIRGQVGAMTLLLQVLNLPTSQSKTRLLQDSEEVFRNSDESAYSIVPSSLSITTSRRNSMASLQSETSIHYRPLTFEDTLFTARVYKRNYRVARSGLRTNLQAKDSVSNETRRHKTKAPASGDDGIVSPPELVTRKHRGTQERNSHPESPRSLSNTDTKQREELKSLIRWPHLDELSEPEVDKFGLFNADGQLTDTQHLLVCRSRYLIEKRGVSWSDSPWSRDIESKLKLVLEYCLEDDTARLEGSLNGLSSLVYDVFHGATICMSAASGHDDSIHTLLSGARSANDFNRLFSSTPLHLALANQHSSTAKLLIIGGARVNVSNSLGVLPLHLACQRCPIDTIVAILDVGADVNCRDKQGLRPLHYAAKGPDRPKSISLLAEKGAVVEALDANNRTALDYACENMRLKSIQVLVRLGYHRILLYEKDIALASAATCGLSKLVYKLLSNEDLDWPSNNNKELLVNDADRARQLLSTVYDGHQTGLQEDAFLLLLGNRGDIIAKDREGNQALHHLAGRRWYEQHDTDLVFQQRLLDTWTEAGAELDAVNNRGDTPLYLAKQNLNMDLVREIWSKLPSEARHQSEESDLNKFEKQWFECG